jgi:undecaprenyl-diphosphatase
MGGLIGLGKLPFWPIFIVTTLGAVAGDQLSYWIGHIYKGRITNISSSERYQRLLAAGQQYFARYGGASVAIGRFIPGLKSVVPAIAGMTSMPLGRFIVLNVVSACAWAAVHLLPGLSAGLTLTNYAGPEGWLDEAVEIAIWIFVIALIVWAVRLIYNWRRPTSLKFER